MTLFGQSHGMVKAVESGEGIERRQHTSAEGVERGRRGIR